VPRKRRSPYEHTVHTKHPRYNVHQYPRGVGEPPPPAPRRDSRSIRGRSLITREGVTKTAHAWRIDDSLSPNRKHVFDEKNREWQVLHNRRDVLTIDHPSNRDVVLKLLKQDLSIERRNLRYAEKRKQAVERRISREGHSPATRNAMRTVNNQIKQYQNNITAIEKRMEKRIKGKPIIVKTPKKRKPATPRPKKNKNQLVGHTTQETAYVIEDYPYGRKLRTKMRIWVETSKKHGQRVVKQTLNPKTGKWNKPKKSTYSQLVLLEKEKKADGRVFVKDKHINVRSDTTLDDLKEIEKTYDLDENQQDILKRLMVGVNARKYIKFTATTTKVDYGDPDFRVKMKKLEKEEKTLKERNKEILDQAIGMSHRELKNKDIIE